MKKSDLNSGMVVETRDRELYLVVGDKLIGVYGCLNLLHYLDNLEHTLFSNFDIIKVYRYKLHYGFSELLKDDNLELIWQRKDIKLTDKEVEILKALKTLGFNWIARNKSDYLYAYSTRPKKLIYHWNEGTSEISLNHLVEFDFIKWEDEEPTNIDDLLKELEKWVKQFMTKY